MSKIGLQTLYLSHLSQLSNFRKECRYFKERLQTARDEQRRIRIEIAQIEFALTQVNIIQFPKPEIVPDAMPIIERVFGRWGAARFEPVNAKQDIKPAEAKAV